MHLLRRLFALAGLALACASAPARPLIIGAISGNPAEEVASYHPLAAHLAGRLRGFGIEGARVTVVPDIPAMIMLMRSGGADLLFDSPFPSIEVNRAAGSRPLLRQWKGGKSAYRSLVLVKQEHSAKSLKDLLGAVIVFEDSYSTSGFLLPRGALVAEGLPLREIASGTKPSPAELGYVFSGSQENSIAWLLRARVDAAAVGNHDYDKLRKAEKDGLRILHQTPEVPRHMVNVRAGLPEPMVGKIRETLLAMEHSEEGRRILAGAARTTRFDEFPEGADKALAPLERIVRALAGATAR